MMYKRKGKRRRRRRWYRVGVRDKNQVKKRRLGWLRENERCCDLLQEGGNLSYGGGRSGGGSWGVGGTGIQGGEESWGSGTGRK